MRPFHRLLERGNIGSLELKNRVIMAPMATHWADDGCVSQRQLDYYSERARGGVGLIMVEATCIQDPLGRAFLRQILATDNRFLPGLSRLAASIKANGARAGIQLVHAGGLASFEEGSGLRAVAPSATQYPDKGSARALTVAEIGEIVNSFAKAAVLSNKAGFDIVEIHAAHSYLLAEFLSPLWNRREDDYGGTVFNRARILTEIAQAVHAEVPTLPIVCRINGAEYGSEEFYGSPALTSDDAQQVAKTLEASGYDAVHVSAFGWGRYGLKLYPEEMGELLPLANAVKRRVHIPVIGVGRLFPDVAEGALRDKVVDFVALGRQLLADPYWVAKLAAGKPEEITPCLGCFECVAWPRRNICTINTRNGEEGRFTLPQKKADKAKRVFVIGGGPGGMEAARVAALHGHDVTLFERSSFLGGNLAHFDKVESKRNLSLLNPYLQRQLNTTGVRVVLGRDVSPTDVIAEKPDAVIIATGGGPAKGTVARFENAGAVYAVEVLDGKAEVGNKVVIVGAGMVGCETAEFLALQGKSVTLVTRRDHIATNVPVPAQRHIIGLRLSDLNVETRLGLSAKSATDRGLTAIDPEGREHFFEADTIILAAGIERNKDGLAAALRDSVPVVKIVGDAVEPRRVIHAIHEGFGAAYSL